MIIFLSEERESFSTGGGGRWLENGFNKINTPSSTLPSLEFAHEEDRRYNNILRLAGASNSWEQSRWLPSGLFPSPRWIVPFLPPPVPNVLSSFLFFYVFQYEFNPRNAGNGAHSSLHGINAFNLSTLGRGKCDGSMRQGFNRDKVDKDRVCPSFIN